MELRSRHLLLVAMSLLLTIHGLVVSRSIPSSLFLIASCSWLWVGVTALIDRLEAARTMATTMIVMLLAIALIAKTTSLVEGNMMAFYLLAMFPSLTAWICVYIYIRHLQGAREANGVAIHSWFAGKKLEQLDRAQESGSFGRQFAEGITGDFSQDNNAPAAWVVSGRQPKLKAAS